ncbi:UDP-N-acetylglucosamine 2-epimerase [Mesorhizobium sp. A623]
MTPRRKICYVTGTRADFGLMLSTLRLLDADSSIDLAIVATGMHLLADYGSTINEVVASGLKLAGRVAIAEGEPGGSLMAANIGRMLIGFTETFAASRPDIVLLLGDRGEMLAGAIAALHLNIPIAHIHGGERSGTIDEPIRHAISKLSHIHLVATEQSRRRLISMGERQDTVHVVGAPGLDSLSGLEIQNRTALMQRHGLDPDRGLSLLVYHPVLHETGQAGGDVTAITDALKHAGLQIVALKPNSDAGGAAVRDILEARAAAHDLTLFTHLPRAEFVQFMANADLMIGNSSSGIIEAASFGTPVINLGSRQNLRERNHNTVDIGIDAAAIKSAIGAIVGAPRPVATNIYGDGRAGPRIAATLAELDLTSFKQGKSNAY